jgi:uncharacterized protein (TIGR02099 family)
MNPPEQAPLPDSSSTHSTQPRRPPTRVAARVLRWALGMGLGVLLLCMAAWWYLLTQIVPKIEQWRGPATEEITRHLGGSRIFIGQMKGFSQGWRPSVVMSDVRLLDPDGHEGLRLPKLTAQLSLQTLWPSNLWQQRVVFHDIVLESPHVVVRRDRLGRWHVAGMRITADTPTSNDQPGLSWLLSQHHVQVMQGTVAWFDEWLSPGQSLDASRTLQQVDIQLSTRGSWFNRLHEWRLQATPPASIGRRLTLVSDMRQPWWRSPLGTPAGASWGLTRVGDWRSWSGQTQVQLPWVDVQALRAWWPLPANVQGGQGALGLTLSVDEGESQELALNLRVQQVSVRLGEGLQPLAFKELRGVIKVAHEPAVTRLAWEGLSFITDEDLIWPASQASLELIHSPSMQAAPGSAAASSPVDGWASLPQVLASPGLEGRLNTNRVDVALLNRLADRLPLGTALRERMASLSPQGIGEELTYTWRGPAQLPSQYQLRGKIKNLSWMAAPGQPGLAGATLSFQADREGGQASVEMRQGWVEFPGAFQEPRIPVDFLKAKVDWKRLPARLPAHAPGLEVRVSQADFANADAQGSVQATWRTSEGDASQQLPGSLDLSGRLSRAQGTRVWRYLPAVILQEARDYVQQAVRSGVATDVGFQVKGPLARFPFKDNQGGLFRITAQANDVELNYAPGWPAFTQLKGQLIFEGQGMRIENATARLGAVGSGAYEVVQVQGSIPDLDSDDPVLTIRGEGRGPLDDVLSFIRVSPVGDWTGRMLHEARGQGLSKAVLDLTLPLNRIEAGTVQGQVSLDAADQANVRLGPGVPLLQSAQGQVQFTQDTLSVKANARVWGQAVTVQGSRDAQGVPRFVASGVLSGDALRQATEWPVLTRLSRYVKGQTPVTVSVALARLKSAGASQTYPELQITSNLAGLALSLPAPLNKPAAAAWPVKIVHRMDSPDAQADAWLMDMQGGPLQFKADYRRDLQGSSPRVVKGLIQLTQGPAPAWPALPATGVVARVSVPVLDTQAWEPVVAMLQSNGGAGGAAESTDDAQAFMPSQVHFKAQTLTWQLRSLRDVSMQITHPAPDVWRARIASSQVAGDVEIRPDTPGKGTAQGAGRRVVAHLSRLAVPDADAQLLNDQAAMQAFQGSTAAVPALDITVDQFEWRGLSLGKLEVQAVNRVVNNPGQSAMPEWRLTKLSLSNPDAQLQATGNWALVGAQQAASQATGEPSRQRAAFSFTLDLANSGSLLNRLGLPQTLKGGKGKVAGQLSWLGSPLEPNTATMNGSMVVNMEEGQFLKAEPGVAKLLGVLSLQSLPRRLILDFRDVFQQGFAFDKVEGDVTIAAGVAQTRNLRMRGVQAVVLMEGQADLARETQNLKVFVVPEVNAGTASLAYAAINPAIGLGTFIAQVLLRKTVVEANTREFAITGTWTDPKVDRVERSSVPAAEGAASGAAPEVPPAADIKASQTPS